MRACTYCGEQNTDAALVCRSCGRSIAPTPTPPLPRAATMLENRVLRNGVLTLLLVLMGVALLYAYRAQSPSVAQVPLSTAISQLQADRVASVTITGPQATIRLRDGSQEQATVGDRPEILERAVLDYNAAHPASPVTLAVQADQQTIGIIGSVLLSLLPVLLIGGFFAYMMRQARGRR